MTKNDSLVLLIALVGLALPGIAQDRAASKVSTSPIYIRNVTLIDTKTGRESKGRTVVLLGERITTIKQDNYRWVPRS
jgi:hypothetical protein